MYQMLLHILLSMSFGSCADDVLQNSAAISPVSVTSATLNEANMTLSVDYKVDDGSKVAPKKIALLFSQSDLIEGKAVLTKDFQTIGDSKAVFYDVNAARHIDGIRLPKSGMYNVYAVGYMCDFGAENVVSPKRWKLATFGSIPLLVDYRKSGERNRKSRLVDAELPGKNGKVKKGYLLLTNMSIPASPLKSVKVGFGGKVFDFSVSVSVDISSFSCSSDGFLIFQTKDLIREISATCSEKPVLYSVPGTVGKRTQDVLMWIPREGIFDDEVDLSNAPMSVEYRYANSGIETDNLQSGKDDFLDIGLGRVGRLLSVYGADGDSPFYFSLLYALYANKNDFGEAACLKLSLLKDETSMDKLVNAGISSVNAGLFNVSNGAIYAQDVNADAYRDGFTRLEPSVDFDVEKKIGYRLQFSKTVNLCTLDVKTKTFIPLVATRVNAEAPNEYSENLIDAKLANAIAKNGLWVNSKGVLEDVLYMSNSNGFNDFDNYFVRIVDGKGDASSQSTYVGYSDPRNPVVFAKIGVLTRGGESKKFIRGWETSSLGGERVFPRAAKNLCALPNAENYDGSFVSKDYVGTSLAHLSYSDVGVSRNSLSSNYWDVSSDMMDKDILKMTAEYRSAIARVVNDKVTSVFPFCYAAANQISYVFFDAGGKIDEKVLEEANRLGMGFVNKGSYVEMWDMRYLKKYLPKSGATFDGVVSALKKLNLGTPVFTNIYPFNDPNGDGMILSLNVDAVGFQTQRANARKNAQERGFQTMSWSSVLNGEAELAPQGYHGYDPIVDISVQNKIYDDYRRQRNAGKGDGVDFTWNSFDLTSKPELVKGVDAAQPMSDAASFVPGASVRVLSLPKIVKINGASNVYQTNNHDNPSNNLGFWKISGRYKSPLPYQLVLPDKDNGLRFSVDLNAPCSSCKVRMVEVGGDKYVPFESNDGSHFEVDKSAAAKEFLGSDFYVALYYDVDNSGDVTSSEICDVLHVEDNRMLSFHAVTKDDWKRSVRMLELGFSLGGLANAQGFLNRFAYGDADRSFAGLLGGKYGGVTKVSAFPNTSISHATGYDFNSQGIDDGVEVYKWGVSSRPSITLGSKSIGWKKYFSDKLKAEYFSSRGKADAILKAGKLIVPAAKLEGTAEFDKDMVRDIEYIIMKRWTFDENRRAFNDVVMPDENLDAFALIGACEIKLGQDAEFDVKYDGGKIVLSPTRFVVSVNDIWDYEYNSSPGILTRAAAMVQSGMNGVYTSSKPFFNFFEINYTKDIEVIYPAN